MNKFINFIPFIIAVIITGCGGSDSNNSTPSGPLDCTEGMAHAGVYKASNGIKAISNDQSIHFYSINDNGETIRTDTYGFATYEWDAHTNYNYAEYIAYSNGALTNFGIVQSTMCYQDGKYWYELEHNGELIKFDKIGDNLPQKQVDYKSILIAANDEDGNGYIAGNNDGFFILENDETLTSNITDVNTGDKIELEANYYNDYAKEFSIMLNWLSKPIKYNAEGVYTTDYANQILLASAFNKDERGVYTHSILTLSTLIGANRNNIDIDKKSMF